MNEVQVVAISDKWTQSIYRVANKDITAMQNGFSGSLKFLYLIYNATIKLFEKQNLHTP
ncbi:MAG: hypothetical protein IKI11_08120 [Neisseriaceae bacterium]|nr:hypothetical protein [Neisseriaceae bacterium]